MKPLFEDESQKQPLDFLSFKSFLDKAFSNPLAVEVAKEYTNDVCEIADMMRKIHSKLPTRGMKARFTKKIRQIELSVEQDNE